MEYHGEVQEDFCYVAGWQCLEIMCEAIRLALDEVGYDKLDQAAVLAGIHRIKDFETSGIVPPMDFTHPDERQGQWSLKMCQVQNGIFVPVSDWIKPPHVILYEGKLYSLPERTLY